MWGSVENGKRCCICEEKFVVTDVRVRERSGNCVSGPACERLAHELCWTRKELRKKSEGLELVNRERHDYKLRLEDANKTIVEMKQMSGSVGTGTGQPEEEMISFTCHRCDQPLSPGQPNCGDGLDAQGKTRVIHYECRGRLTNKEKLAEIKTKLIEAEKQVSKLNSELRAVERDLDDENKRDQLKKWLDPLLAETTTVTYAATGQSQRNWMRSETRFCLKLSTGEEIELVITHDRDKASR